MPDPRTLIPHRPPMLLVDEILSRTDRQLHARRTFRDQDVFVQGHFPGNPVVPGVMLCEAALQAGALLMAHPTELPSESHIPVVSRMHDVKFKQLVHPGDTIDIVVELREEVAGAFLMSARIRVREKLAASLEFRCTWVGRTPTPREPTP